MTPEEIADNAADEYSARTHDEWELIRGIVQQAIYDDRARRESLLKLAQTLLIESQRLGLTFDRGNAYISAAYIEHQRDLKERINKLIGEIG